MVPKERFQQGMNFQQYLDQMTTNKEKFLQHLQEVKIRPEDREALSRFPKPLKIMVITEDWCSDALTNVPVLAKLVEGVPGVEIRLFLRDKNPDLMDQYLYQGVYRSIPVFAFFDQNMNELARFLERPSAITEFIDKKLRELRQQLRQEHLAEWRQGAVDEIRTLLKV